MDSSRLTESWSSDLYLVDLRTRSHASRHMPNSAAEPPSYPRCGTYQAKSQPNSKWLQGLQNKSTQDFKTLLQSNTCSGQAYLEMSLPPLSPVLLCDTVFPQHRPPSTAIPITSLEGIDAMAVVEAQAFGLPTKRHGRLLRNIRWTWLSTYRCLYLLIFSANVTAIALLAIRKSLFSLSPAAMTTPLAINLTVSVLIRQDLVINLLFLLVGKCPRWIPLRVRRRIAKIYHLGGVHSGAGMAAVLWFALFNVVTVRYSSNVVAIIAVTTAIDVLLLTIVILAYPTMRSKYHNAFEATHRFAGWISIALFWVLLFVLSDVERKISRPTPQLSVIIAKSPAFYCLSIITTCLVMPWVRLRRVPVTPEPLSKHAIRLHFTYTDLPLCAAPRLSDRPWKEWHAFAGIPEDAGHGFSVIVSRAGDWTGKIIDNPPTAMWVRGVPTIGVLHVAPIFKKVVLVATGSGIGPILSLLQARNISCRILWSTKNPETTYKWTIVDAVRQADSEAVIIDRSLRLILATSESASAIRPLDPLSRKSIDLVLLSWNIYTHSHAEAVFVISNPKTTRKIVYGLESRGVPTFAPIFDS